MCQRNNFYGDDDRVENFLDQKIERKAATIIKKIIVTNSLPDIKVDFSEYEHLITFLLVSEGRNLKIADSVNNLADSLAKTMLKLKKDIDFSHIDIDRYSVKLNNPANETISIALSSVPLIFDLEPIIIFQKTPRKFITSDNPLIRYNSFFVHRKYHGRGFGYADRGLQLFFPISSDKCLLLYDSLVYDIPGVKDNILYLERAREVDFLNELIYLNSYNNVFFHEKVKEDYLRKIALKNKRTPKLKELEREIQYFSSNDPNSLLLTSHHNRVTKRINLPWIRLTKHAKQLKLPAHLGGLQRVESPFIRDFLKEKYESFED